MNSESGGKPIENLLYAVMQLAMRRLESRHNAQLQLLREQIRMRRAQLDAERILVLLSKDSLDKENAHLQWTKFSG